MVETFAKTTVICNTCKKLVDKDRCVAIHHITQSLNPTNEKAQEEILYCCLDCKPGYYALHPDEYIKDFNISQPDMLNDLFLPLINKEG